MLKDLKLNKYNAVWKCEGYFINRNNEIFSKHGNKLKRTVKGYTIGYWLNGKFRSLRWIKNNCKKIDIICPF